EPALTDALVALGLIDPQNFLGGRMVLDGEGAVAAVARLGRAVGLEAAATARGMYRLALEEMRLAVHGLLVERGLDPRRFAFLCYGGCGPLFGAPLARALALGRVIVPALAAVFSAVGAGRLGDAFRARYAELYGTGALAAAAPIDLVNCRVIATARLPRPALAPAPLGPTDASPAQRGVRTVWLPGGEDGRPVALYDGERLAPGMAVTGAAL